MARNVKFEIRRGAGSSLEVLFGKVSLTPTMLHTVANSVVLPAPSTFDLVNGVAIATNVAPSPAPVGGQVPWAYKVKISDNFGKSWEYLVGVPDGTTEINFNVLPRYFETKPPLFGQGEQGVPGSSATIAIGTTTSGPTPAVTNTGTSTEAVLNFTLAKGDKGDNGDGVSFETKLFSDSPATYANGTTYVNGSIAAGWPVDFLTVTTNKQSWGRTVQWLTNVTKSYVAFRTDQSGTWTSLQQMPSNSLATPLLNGLMPALDKAKLDGMTPAANSKTFAALASTYQAGFSVLQVRASDGWPIATTGTLVTQKTSTGNASVGQWLYPVEGGAPQYRVSDAAGFWGVFQFVVTEDILQELSTAINASDYFTIQEAVDAAYTLKRPLLVDSDIIGTDVSSRFYEIQVVGKGSLTLGGNKFWVNPQHQGIQTNRIFVNPTTGSDLNSGISPLAPVKSFTRLNINLTMLREKLLDGFWEIIIQSGTHMVDAGWRMNGLRTKWPLVIKGEGTLATILDGTNDTLGKAFYFKQFDTSVTFQNLHIRNYIGGSSAGAEGDIDTSAGIICQGPGLLRVENCRVQNCSTGISGGYGATVQIYGCTIEGSLPRSVDSSMNVGIVILYGASGTIGTFNWKNTFKNITNAVHVTRNAVAHVDYNDIVDCYYGMQASHNARAAVLDGVFHRNMVAINMTGGSECTYATADFGVGVNANILHNVRFSGSSKFTQYQGAYPSASEFRLYEQTNVPPLEAPTGSTSPALISNFPSTASIPANTLFGLNKRIRFKIHGLMGGTGYRTIQVRKSDRAGLNPTYLNDIVSPAGYTGNFTLEIEINKSHVGGNFRVANTLIVDGKPAVIRHGYLSGVDISHDWLFRLYKTDNTTDNTMSILTQEIYVTG